MEEYSRYTEYQSEAEMDSVCLDLTSDGRFAKVGGASIKTPFGEIFNGLDRDTGNEVMWRAINVNKVDQTIFTKWLQELQQIVKLDCKHLLKYFRCERRSERQIILISEMISRGSLSTYLTTFKHPRLTVCQAWFRQILEGLQYLHSCHITHGHLKCDHIYINSNTGELKIGDLCLVKLPGIMSDRLTFHRPIDDIHHFGLVMLEVAFAQMVSPLKLRKIMQRLYDAPALDKKRMARFLKHIDDEDYRSLIETCIYADSSATPKDILGHRFFTTTRTKDETLRGLVKKVRKEARKPHVSKFLKPCLNLIVTQNSLKMRPNSVESHLINVAVTIIGRSTTSTIKFVYDMDYDTPETVAQEMREALALPEEYIAGIQTQIRSVIQDYINGLAKSMAHPLSKMGSNHKMEAATGGTLQRDYSAEYLGDAVQRRPLLPRQPSISGSISPIDTCSAASICTSNTVMENLKAIFGRNIQSVVPTKLFSNREESLQPEVAYSDIQLTPRNEGEEEGMAMSQKLIKGGFQKRYSGVVGLIKEWSGTDSKKVENTSEADEGDRKGKPII